VDGYTYFLSNRGDKIIDGWIPLNANAASVALFEPMTTKAGLATWRLRGKKNIEVVVQLKPYESIIVRLFNTKKAGNNFPYTKPQGEPVKIEGEWKLSFLTGGPTLPAPVSIKELSSWTILNGDEYKSFSGTAKYSISFPKPTGNATNWLLDLGKVNETAEVILNGKKLATLIGPTFQVVIPSGEIKQTNTIEIIVANLMANRIAYMDKNNIPWKKFYNTNMPARKRENSKNGLFDASNWEALPSGLSGPVTLTPVGYGTK
jgi:hypothetical protein